MPRDLLFFYLGIGCLMAAGGSSLLFWRSWKATLLTWVRIPLSAGMILLGLAMALRSLQLGHLAVASAYEAVSAWLALIILVYLLVDRRGRFRALVAFIAPFLALLSVIPLVAARNGKAPVAIPAWTPWLDLHILSALGGYAIFTLGFLLSLMYLLQERQLKRRALTSLTEFLPSLEELDRANYLLIGRAFTIFTVAILTGLVLVYRQGWKEGWLFDPKILFTLVTWGVYSALFHIRGAGLVRGRKIAWGTILGFLLVLATFFLVELFHHGRHQFL